MYNDPSNPYGTDYSGYDTTTEEYGDPTSDGTRPLNPGGDGYWKLMDGIWRWMTEPLGRTAVTTPT